MLELNNEMRKKKICTKRNSCIHSLFYAMCKFSAHSPSMAKTVFQSSTFHRITCGRQWGSFTVEDHLRSTLGIVCGTVQN